MTEHIEKALLLRLQGDKQLASGNVHGAETYYVEALTIRETLGIAEDIETAVTMLRLSRVAELLKNPIRSQRFIIKANLIRERLNAATESNVDYGSIAARIRQGQLPETA